MPSSWSEHSTSGIQQMKHTLVSFLKRPILSPSSFPASLPPLLSARNRWCPRDGTTPQQGVRIRGPQLPFYSMDISLFKHQRFVQTVVSLCHKYPAFQTFISWELRVIPARRLEGIPVQKGIELLKTLGNMFSLSSLH